MPPKSSLCHPVNFFATGFGSGLSPIMPGTCGTLVAVPCYFVLAQTSLLIYTCLLIVAAIVGIGLCASAAKNLQQTDPPSIVWDEMVGYWVTMWACPLQWQWILLGFIYFRVLDIAKPWPISVCDRRVKGGLGIMLDDLVAGILAALLLWATRTVIGTF